MLKYSGGEEEEEEDTTCCLYLLPCFRLPPGSNAGVHNIAKFTPKAVFHPGVGTQGEQDRGNLSRQTVEDSAGQVGQDYGRSGSSSRLGLLEHVELQPPVHRHVPADDNLHQRPRYLPTAGYRPGGYVVVLSTDLHIVRLGHGVMPQDVSPHTVGSEPCCYHARLRHEGHEVVAE